jgi:hypothetical protein
LSGYHEHFRQQPDGRGPRGVYLLLLRETKNKPVVLRRLLPILLDDYTALSPERRRCPTSSTIPPRKWFLTACPAVYSRDRVRRDGAGVPASHLARMNAMHSATTNAQEMLKTLRTEYNMAGRAPLTNGDRGKITGCRGNPA